jgi:hypothetical protein
VVMAPPAADKLLAQYDGVSAVWVSDTGEWKRSYGASPLQLSDPGR